ncbi:MAG: hypothetical protein IT372_17230 [Polyangiaceae bacterium]|nr:hypothetical protein [Polyangiaceae bacterium]
MNKLHLAAIAILTCAPAPLAGCSGGVVVDPPGSGGGGGGSTTSTTSTTSTSTSTGGCQSHDQCPGGQLCIFGSGQCAPACDASTLDPCGPGLVCDPCATSSCPGCENCTAACLPAAPGQCDDHDDCAQGSVCIYGSGQCAPACDESAPACPDPDLVCNPCATGSCPGCDDCVGACTESF